jgi:pyrimidine-nucleoside phosphorylase
MRALITDMDRPLGRAVGNSLEVVEAIETLKGHGPADFTELCVALATHMLVISDRGTEADCEAAVRRVMADGTALGTFADMVEAQGGDPSWIYHPENFPVAPFTRPVLAPADGFITAVDCEGYGTAALLLGAGRNRKEDVIDPAAGMILHAKTGDAVVKGQPIATLCTSRESLLDGAEKQLLESTTIGDAAPEARPLIFGVVE